MDGLNRYRLFFNKAVQVDPGKEYIAEGVYAQKAIDAIGDPNQGKNGYPLGSSCDSVVRTAWPALAFDVVDSYSTSLCAKVKRFPARPVFLVASDPARYRSPMRNRGGCRGRGQGNTESLRSGGQTTRSPGGGSHRPTAPLWEPSGGTVRCKVVIDEEGKIAELDSGTQLCESVPWSQFRYQPTLKGGHPVRVNTEVEIRFDPRK